MNTSDVSLSVPNLSYLHDLEDVDSSKIQGGGVDARETFVCTVFGIMSSPFLTPAGGGIVGATCLLAASEID